MSRSCGALHARFLQTSVDQTWSSSVWECPTNLQATHESARRSFSLVSEQHPLRTTATHNAAARRRRRKRETTFLHSTPSALQQHKKMATLMTNKEGELDTGDTAPPPLPGRRQEGLCVSLKLFVSRCFASPSSAFQQTAHSSTPLTSVGGGFDEYVQRYMMAG